MLRAMSLQKNTVASTMSSAVTMRLSGARSIMALRIASTEIPRASAWPAITRSIRSPSTAPGATQFLIDHEDWFKAHQETAGVDYARMSESARTAYENRQDILVNAYVQDYLERNPVTEDTLKKEYERIKTQLGGREYKARHILVESENEAKDVIAQLKKGASFEKLAAERSKDTGTKDKGGDLDWSVPGNYVKPFGDALAKLKKGQMTDAPVQSNFGWHVIRLEDERAYQAPAYDAVKQNLQRSLQQQMVQKMLAELRSKAKVE